MPGVRAARVLETRERIAAAAIDLFARDGFERVTVAAVARAAGVTEKTVFNHFGTKEDLVYSRADEFGDELVDAVATRASGVSAFEALRRHLLGVYAAFPGAGAARHPVLSHIVADSPALQAREQRIIVGYAARLAETIAVSRVGAGPDLVPRVLAHAVMGLHAAVIEAYRRAALDGEEPATYGPRTLAAVEAAFEALAAGL